MLTELGSGRMLRYFALPTAAAPHGLPFDLARLRRRRHLVVFFHHGADCAACQAALSDLAANAAPITAEGATIISVGPDAPLLHTPDSATDNMALIALVDPTMQASAAQGVTAPTLMLADRFGEVYARWSDPDHALPSATEVVAWLLRIDTLCNECTTPEWEATRYTSE